MLFRSRAPETPKIIPIILLIVIRSPTIIDAAINTMIGFVVIIRAPLMGAVRSSPLKNKSWLIATPNTAQKNNLILSDDSNFSFLKNRPANQKTKAVKSTLITMKPKGFMYSGMMPFAML